MMRKKWINLFVFSLITVCSTAQTKGYKFYSPLDSVKESGFYNIALTPAVNAHLKKDYSDVRIVNNVGRWVPHIFHHPSAEKTNHAAIMDLKFTITENTKVNTVLVIQSLQNVISNIGLVINNTAAERFCALSGSNDSKNWFVINDSILVNPIPDEATTKKIFRINFPTSNYRFFKIIIKNNNKDPFDIKNVIQESSAIINNENKLIPNPATVILQKDSGKISYLKITQQQPYHFDNISIKISGVKYFYRKVDVYIPFADNHSFANPGQLLQTFTISNNSTLQFKIPISNAKFFYLLINNEDNLPLTVSEVNTTNSYHYITAYLEKGDSYKLILDNPVAVTPNYDLTNLNKTIPDSAAFLTAGKVMAFKQNEITAAPAKNNKWLLWAALIAALFILLLFTQKMIKEVNKRKQDDTI
jgi:hypothetical protein